MGWRMVILLEHHPNDSRLKIEESEICQSLTGRMGTGGGNVPLIWVIDEDTDTDREKIF